MMVWFGALIVGIVGYVLGALPSGYYISRARGVDIRQVGSGNVGATNVFRSVGKVWGVVVFLMDFAKGVLAATVVPVLSGRVWQLQPPVEWYLVGGAAAVIGHNWPVFLRFQGGKGIATTFGAVVGWMPILALWSAGTWAIVFAVTRYVSVASLASMLVLPLILVMQGRSLSWVLAGVFLCLMATSRHRANISRLLQGKEHRFSTVGRR